MTAPGGLGAVRTIDDLMLRCVVDDITGCWHWRGAGAASKVPSLQLPALGRVVSLGVAIGFLRTGSVPKRGVVWHCTCDTPRCANPDHRRAGTRSSQMLAAKLKRTPAVRARITASLRRNAKVSDQQVADIRAGGAKLKEIASQYGITVGYACELRSGKRRPPLAAPSSSVFAWRP